MSQMVTNMLAVNRKWLVIKATLKKYFTCGKDWGLQSIRMRRWRMKPGRRSGLSDGCYLRLSLGRRMWRLIKADPENADVGSYLLPLPEYSVAEWTRLALTTTTCWFTNWRVSPFKFERSWIVIRADWTKKKIWGQKSQSKLPLENSCIFWEEFGACSWFAIHTIIYSALCSKMATHVGNWLGKMFDNCSTLIFGGIQNSNHQSHPHRKQD